MKKIVVLFAVTLMSISVLAQQEPKKRIEAVRTQTPPKIDGVLDDIVWENVPIANDFVQFSPYNGKKSSQKTEVKFVYDDDALYVGAMLYDSAPDSIFTELGKRDDGPSIMADFFTVDICPSNDNLVSFNFMVTASGIQTDRKISYSGEDKNWDAVWQSEVKINDKGWIVEMKIPYSAIRFNKSEEQIWGINMWRNIRRYNNEFSTWQPVDNEKNEWYEVRGEINKIKNIKPPLRLSLTPYINSRIEKTKNSDKWESLFNGGMDLKYGINESFTLDMMLVPDFGDVQSDDQILNLSPFETKFDEKRQFFTEGTELFSKGNLFYSKRIGARPSGYGAVNSALAAGTYTDIKENPTEAKIINATKITGRNKKGLGVGFLNAMTMNTYAEVTDENNNERKVLTEPFTNYNILIFDQSLKHNSYVSFLNTNVLRERENYTANVTGTDFKLKNKKETYEISGNAALSQIYRKGSDKYGYQSKMEIAKISGNFRFNIYNQIESDKYNPNDLGFLLRNNNLTNSASLKYNIYKPFGNILYFFNTLEIVHTSLYKPTKYNDFGISLSSNIGFKNNMSASTHIRIKPYEEHDYFEARVSERKFIKPRLFHICGGINTDSRKRLSIGLHGGFDKSYSYDINQINYSIDLSPRFRVNDKFLLDYSIGYAQSKNEIGYVNRTGDDQTIYFGERETKTINNTFTTNYIFNNKSSLNFRVRHYWSRAKYDKFYELKTDGNLASTSYTGNHDINYNAFNIDFVYTWRFAPGSELSVIWKTAIDEAKDLIRTNSYSDNFKDVLDLPSASSLSVKLFYYLDWKKFKKRG